MSQMENEHCPVCGYYCLGKGGVGCIDKPGLVRVSPPPTPDVERLRALIGSSLLPLGSVRRRIIAVRKEHPSSVKLAAAQEKLDQVINVFEALVVGDTPTPGGEQP